MLMVVAAAAAIALPARGTPIAQRNDPRRAEPTNQRDGNQNGRQRDVKQRHSRHHPHAAVVKQM